MRSPPRSRELAGDAAVVLTTGGTGVAPRDVTPEATRSRDRPRGARDRRGDPRRLAREDAARAALARSRGRPRRAPSSSTCPGSPGGCRDGFAVLQPGARARARAARREPRRRTGRHDDDGRLAARAASRRSSSSSTRSSRSRSRTSGCCSRSASRRAAADWLWVTVAMVGARTLAMGLNRLIDAEVDARNPRTARRELPAGTLSRGQVLALCAARARRLPRRRLPARPGRALALADPGRRSSSSTRT